MAQPALPAKTDVSRALLLRGSVFVHLDPRCEGVEVPEWLRHQSQLVLQIGLDMTVPIPDLKVDERGFSGTLSFSRMPHFCHVPWNAIFALVGEDGRGMVWPEDLPTEIAAEVAREVDRAAEDNGLGQTHITALDGGRKDEPIVRRPRHRGDLPPYLRVVK